MPLAKSVPQPTPPPQPPQPQAPAVTNVTGFEGIPFEVYRFFNVAPSNLESNDFKQIKEVYKWAESEGLGDSLYKLRTLEMKVGAPSVGETRYTKLYNWVRVSNIVSNLEREREEQVNKVMKKRELEIKRIKQEQAQRLAEIEKKKKAEETAIKKSREAELRQFKKLRQAYE